MDNPDSERIIKGELKYIASKGKYHFTIFAIIALGICYFGSAAWLLFRYSCRGDYLIFLGFVFCTIWFFIYRYIIHVRALRAMYLKYEAGETGKQ
ncbi:MAG: hypothetical protein JW941_13575 [Candidatus Coatesbacteria bacterium]|nr:hypothetical protein [Candidatus Coatesbacteria bacterium]